jgi:hypothetical protein
VLLYSYGSKDDNVMADIDDSCSEAIRYMQGVPVFDQLYTDIYVRFYVLGLIRFDM